MPEQENGKKRVNLNSELGMSRRDLLRRGAIVGGTLIWAAPAIQSFGTKAWAQDGGPGSAQCSACYCYSGSLSSPSKEIGVTDFFTAPGQASAQDCSDWCTHSGAYSSSGGASGGPYTSSQYCSGTSCTTCVGTQLSSCGGTHGASCS